MKMRLKRKLSICRLHCIAITFDADKLNISFNKKQEIAATIKSNSNQILILLKECLEQDNLYSEIPKLLETYEYFCSEEQLMESFEQCAVLVCTLFSYIRILINTNNTQMLHRSLDISLSNGYKAIQKQIFYEDIE